MNCPNCGGILDLNNKHCTYCDTTFTYEELHPESKSNTKTEVKPAESEKAPEKPKTMTEKRIEELKKEKQQRKTEAADTTGREVAIGATVLGVMGLFSGVRRFFRNLKKTVCLIILVALEIGFAFLMISGYVTQLMKDEITGYVAVNVLILANALIAGIICRIGRIRVGTALVGIVNFLAVIWVFVYPMITTDFAGMTAQSVAVFAVIEMAVLAVGLLLTHLIYKRHF